MMSLNNLSWVGSLALVPEVLGCLMISGMACNCCDETNNSDHNCMCYLWHSLVKCFRSLVRKIKILNLTYSLIPSSSPCAQLDYTKLAHTQFFVDRNIFNRYDMFCRTFDYVF